MVNNNDSVAGLDRWRSKTAALLLVQIRSGPKQRLCCPLRPKALRRQMALTARVRPRCPSAVYGIAPRVGRCGGNALGPRGYAQLIGNGRRARTCLGRWTSAPAVDRQATGRPNPGPRRDGAPASPPAARTPAPTGPGVRPDRRQTRASARPPMPAACPLRASSTANRRCVTACGHSRKEGSPWVLPKPTT